MPEEREISLVIGTAGHIDHGKTTLIAALTGVDCDRLMEEKKRGITIELGFAPLRLADGRVVSVIDVPGHERFIRQMVAGASGVDAVLLVVAADESVMPQTREHLAILELLGVKDGLVAITKTDRVEPGMAELVEEDVRDFVRGTFLEGKAVVPVSASTGENIERLKGELAALVDRVRPRPRKGALFLPIDRAFPISGFGTVVTGTAYRGIARAGDEIEIFPSAKQGRIRSLQVHGRSVEEAFAGQRVAANLSNISVDELERGDVVCRKGVYATTRCFDAVLSLLPTLPDPLRHWQRVRLYVGTSDVLARVALLRSRQLEPGTRDEPVQLVAEEDVVCTAEERFIIRFYSPLITIGGGRVIFPYSHKPRGSAARGVAAARIGKLSAVESGDERLQFWVEEMGMADAAQAAAAVQETSADLEALAARALKKGALFELKGDKPLYLSPKRFEELRGAVLGELGHYHSAFASEAGMPLDELARRLRMDVKAVRSLTALLAEQGAVTIEDNRVRRPDFVPKSEGTFREKAEALLGFCRDRSWQLATLDEAREFLKMDPKTFAVLVQSLKASKSLVILAGEYVLTAEMEDAMLAILRKIGGDVTLAAVRDATQSSRKYILPVLEYFDSKGHTRRVGDVRAVRGTKA